DLVHFLSHGRQVVPNLFIGGRLVAENDEWLDASVDFIINVSGKRFAYFERFADRMASIELDDNAHADAAQLVAGTADRLATLLDAGKRVLLHCWQGKSRSAALITAFLILKRGMTLVGALELMAEKNRGHMINAGFMQQLERLECRHRGL